MKAIFIYTRVILLAGIFLFCMNGLYAQNEENEGKEKEHKHHNYEMKGMSIEDHGDSTTVITIHKNDWDWPMKHHFCWKKHKYNGHWAGVDFGWNGYVNRDFKMDFPDYPFMDMNVARSLMVNLNPFELNLNLAKQHFGFTTGLGFQLSNYYFTGNDKMLGDSAKLVAYPIYDDKGNPVDLKVNKLFTAWLTLPVLFEYQTNRGMRLNSFHVTLGVIGALRIGSYTKQTFHTWNQFYYLRDEGKDFASFYTDKKFVRDHGVFHQNNFKLDATLRIGWSFLNFFGTYSLTPMFKKDHGPELYPWTLGITLVGW